MTVSLADRQALGKSLFQMTWPMLFGVFSLMSFQLVDSAFIARLGVSPLAVQGFTLPMHLVIIGLQVGLGIATTAIISRTLGRGEELKARQLGGLVVVTGAILILILCIILWLLQAPIIDILGGSTDLLPLVERYWLPWLVSAWVGAMLYFGYSLSRSHGNTLLPGIMMVVTSLLNMALDPLYIFVFDWGLPGAAYATITSFTLGCLIVYPTIVRRHWLSFHQHALKLKATLLELGSIMAPAMLSQLMPPISAMLATKLVAGFGYAAVGAWALGSRVEFFSIVVVLALTMSLPPMVGRLLGSREFGQIRYLVSITVRFVLVWQLVIALVLIATSTPLAELFSEDTDVREILNSYLFRVPMSSGALGVCMIMVSICNAMGLAMRALLISCLRLFVCFLPLIWLGSYFGGIDGLLSGAMLGNIAAGIVAWVLYTRGMKTLIEEEQANSLL